MTNNKLRCYRKFLSSQTQCFFCNIKRHSLYFKDKTSWCYWGYKSLRISFSFTHTYI